MLTNSGSQGPWDQAKFERLLTEWIVACDQPFDEVKEEEFIKLMTYARHQAPSVKLPGWEGIWHRVMKMGEETVDGIREMFAVQNLNNLRRQAEAHWQGHIALLPMQNCAISYKTLKLIS